MNQRIEKILNERIPIGIVGRVHGLDGEVRFFPFTNIPEILENLDEVFLYSDEKKRGFFLKVESMRLGSKSILMKFQEFNTREDSKVLEGFRVYIRKDELPRLEEGEYYYEEVYGCEVYEDEKDIGKVIDIIETGSNEVLVVRNEENEETLIPMVKDYVEEIDVQNKIIRVKKMKWI